jgi:uncharacterized membrane protein YkvA (DUF1232 family)
MHYVVTQAERDQIGRIMRLPMRRRLRLLWSVLRDRRITPVMEAPLVAALTYVLLPMNLFPRKLFLIRTFDDVIVAAVGLWLFVKLVPEDVLEDHIERIERHHDEE